MNADPDEGQPTTVPEPTAPAKTPPEAEAGKTVVEADATEAEADVTEPGVTEADEPAAVEAEADEVEAEPTEPEAAASEAAEPEVIEAALQQIPGRAIVNSVNLEAGRAKLDRVVPLAEAHGAALIALTIDEAGMAKTAERKLEVAQRITHLCCDEHELEPEALIGAHMTRYGGRKQSAAEMSALYLAFLDALDRLTTAIDTLRVP